jgi:hypothetical protein
MSPWSARAGWCLVLLLLGGCPGTRGESEASAGSDEPASTSPARRLSGATLTVDGQAWRFTSRDDGYKLKAGERRVEAKIEADRVKVKDQADVVVAKVKLKDDGFKLYDGKDTELLKATRVAGGFKLQKASDEEMGRIDGSGGTLGSSTVTVERVKEGFVVKRDGAAVAAIDKDVPPDAAALLGVTEVGFEARLGMLLLAAEVAR